MHDRSDGRRADATNSSAPSPGTRSGGLEITSLALARKMPLGKISNECRRE